MHISSLSFSGTHLNFTKLPALLNIPWLKILQESRPLLLLLLFIVQSFFVYVPIRCLLVEHVVGARVV